jgi:hypothetical protein
MVVPAVQTLATVLPASFMHSQLYAVLAAFVAINTVMYGALALAKMLPKVYPSDWVRGRNRRVEVRGIHPAQVTPLVGPGVRPDVDATPAQTPELVA